MSSRTLKELNNLRVWGWDPHKDKHPPGAASKRDFEKVEELLSGRQYASLRKSSPTEVRGIHASSAVHGGAVLTATVDHRRRRNNKRLEAIALCFPLCHFLCSVLFPSHVVTLDKICAPHTCRARASEEHAPHNQQLLERRLLWTPLLPSLRAPPSQVSQVSRKQNNNNNSRRQCKFATNNRHIQAHKCDVCVMDAWSMCRC